MTRPDMTAQDTAQDHPSTETCRLTIGLPVYNGERHVARAIESILVQTFADFRLIILDNASTDRTAEIARHYVRRDRRVAYRRNHRNVGAAPNFNQAFKLSRSMYFKWAAHDDELMPTYLEKCVRALDAEPGAVLAHAHVREVDDAGRVVRIYKPVGDAVGSPIRSRRFASRVMQRGWCTEIFGVIRAEALAGSMMIASFAGSDLSLITELCLRGRFIIIPEPLFVHRIHSARYSNAVLEKAKGSAGREHIMAWYDTSKAATHRRMHWWIFFTEYFRMIDRNVRPWPSRLRYYLIVMRWLTIRNNCLDLAKDLICVVSPRLLDWLTRLKQGLEARKRGLSDGEARLDA
jgi:glycosyltransferase involved in cell wall biosynthesis